VSEVSEVSVFRGISGVFSLPDGLKKGLKARVKAL